MNSNGSDGKRDRILIIAPTVPRPDMNSGDVRLSAILGILAKEYELYFFARGIGSGDTGYIAAMQQLGIKVIVEELSLKLLLKREIFKAAILEFYFVAEYYLDRIRLLQPECRVVIDSVDVHYLRLKMKHDLSNAPEDHAEYLKTRKRELAMYRGADAVITVTRDDADALRATDPDIACEVVPNIHEICLGDGVFEPYSLIFVGGFLHEPNVDAMLHFCGEVLPLIRQKRPEVTLTIVGSNPPPLIRSLANDHITVTGYVPETSPYLHRSHVSIAPLRFGAGMKGKIGEAMAHGIPVVSTAVGVQGMGLTNRDNVMVADSPSAFAEAVIELFDNPVLHAEIGRRAVQMIEERYTAAQVGRSMLAAVERISRKPVRKMKMREKLSFMNDYITRRIRTGFSACRTP